MKKLLLALFNHERYQTISIIFSLLLLVVWLGCDPKASSIRNPAIKLNRTQLQAELDGIIAQVQNSVTDMNKQEELLNYLFQQSVIIGQTGAVNPIGILVGLGGILGIGAGIDNARKRKTIKTLEKSNNGTP